MAVHRTGDRQDLCALRYIT